MSRGSSRRRTRFPTNVSVFVAVAMIASYLLPARARCRGFHCVDDVLISGAAADIAFQAMPNLIFSRGWIALQNLLRSHDHSRRAESALQPVLVPERFLHAVQLPVACESFHRDDVRAVRLRREHRAALDGFAVQLHGARAAER